MSNNDVVTAKGLADRISEELASRHEGTEIKHTVCVMNGCWNGCLLKCEVKDGEIVSIDAGDPVNPNDPREDVGLEAVTKGMIQQRPCARGRMWRKTVDNGNRILYPMRNVGEKGAPVWERLTWDEALDLAYEKMKGAIDEFGPLSIRCAGSFDLGMYAGFGFAEWGTCSWAGHGLAYETAFGFDDMAGFNPFNPDAHVGGTEPPDLLNAKLIIGLGWNPAVTHPAYAYILSLAKEQGTPIIMVDPRYTPTAQAYADQWIPIRTGTDAAFMTAIANVLFKEDLLDHGFVDKFVEPAGLDEWRGYVLGESDGVDKTPEWAEPICAVPAETIRELARLYGAHHGYSDGNPCYFKLHWSVARTAMGEDTARIGIYLQALTGNMGMPGGMNGGCDGFVPASFPMPRFMRGTGAPCYLPPTCLNLRTWPEAVLLHDDYEAGRMSEEEYRNRIGCAQDAPIPNIKVLFIHGQQSVVIGTHDEGQVRRAMKKTYVICAAQHMDRPEVLYADLVFPATDHVFESFEDAYNTGGFVVPCEFACSTYGNYFILKDKVVEAPGEARPRYWIHSQLAKRFGCLDTFNPRFADVLDDMEAWDERYREIQRESYEAWRPYYAAWAAENGVEPAEAPTYEEMKKVGLFRVPLTREPWYGFKECIQDGVPFGTKSQKIEFSAEHLKKANARNERIELVGAGMPFGGWGYCYGGAEETVLEPVAKYRVSWDGALSPTAEEYPLRMITPHSFFRTHYAQDNNLWMPDEARHAIWMNPVDAAARGIKDGDEAHVFNPQGEAIMPVYVTGRIAPGTICNVYGAWYQPGEEKTELMPDGIDMRGSANCFTSAKQYPYIVGNLHCAHQAQVELHKGE